MTAVYSAHTVVVFIASKFQSLFYDRCEVLVIVCIPAYMHKTLVAYDRGGIHSVPVAFAGRHQAVGCKQDRRRNIFKFLLLALP